MNHLAHGPIGMKSILRAWWVLVAGAWLAVAAVGCGGGGSAAEQVQLREANMIFYSMPG